MDRDCGAALGEHRRQHLGGVHAADRAAAFLASPAGSCVGGTAIGVGGEITGAAL